MEHIAEAELFNSFAKGARSAKARKGTNCVIYTRVSTKEQAENNLSLETQRKACSQYAERQGYTVMANFGGTYESAQTDERKEFTAMLSYVRKCREKVSFIIVYSLERFSRNDNSIWLSGQLRQLGIEIVSVTQPIDTSNPSGQMQQKMLFLFGEFDNQLRKQKCMAGVKDMLLRGDWPTMPPLGFDIVKINGKRNIVVNEKGRLLKLAFLWKAHENLTNEAIRARLADKGLKLNHQRISEIFRNPFYCGLMAHNMLEGRVIPGNHEQLVSREIFLKVNGLLDRNTHGYTINEENEAIPLKRFVHCDSCGKPLRGYIVQKKNIYYYKCNTVGCANNKSAKSLNGTFADILGYFNLGVAPDVAAMIKEQMMATFNAIFRDQPDEQQILRDRYKEIHQKINRLEERFIEEEISAELYDKYMGRYKLEKKEIEEKLLKFGPRVSNHEECIDLAMEYAAELPSKWLSADYLGKQQLQSLVFPEGIRYNKKDDGCRTTRINLLFGYIANLQQDISQKKRGIPELGLDYASFADLVAQSRIELLSSV